MNHRVINFVEKHHMLEQKDRIVVGISGGADSVCLFFMLLDIRKQYDLTLYMVHINHGIRGSEADADQHFAEELARKHQIPIKIFKQDVRAYAKVQGISEEEAGRQIRYEAFYQVLKDEKATKIAVAHTMNDNAETMLFNLARGTGIKGLCAVPPVRDQIIRPLLCITRNQVEQYLNERGQPYCTDTTNLMDDYSRNRIRHHIIPAMEEQINVRTIENMSRAAELLRETQIYMEKNIQIAFQRIAKECKGQYLLEIEVLKKEEPIIQKEVLRKTMYSLAGRLKDIDNRHVEQLMELLSMKSGKRISLPYGIVAEREYKIIRIGQIIDKMEDFEIAIKEEGEYKIPAFDSRILVTVEHSFPNLNEIIKNDYTKWFDYDKICQSISLRNRRAGDYFQVNAQGGTKKLKDYFIDAKVPRSRRDSYPLLAMGSHILWILGERASEGYKITESTKNILKVKLVGGKKDEC